VEGSQSNQQFYEAGYFPTEEQSHIIVLKLMGTKGGKQVLKAITVKTKTKCHTCGTTNKSGVKFCRECGTSLELV
jgi:tRNA(Ile2) C34 agmatinyltransferase TiaS